MNEYQLYLEQCLEFGGQPVSRQEFEAILIEEKEVR